MKRNTQQSLLDRWNQIRSEVVSVGMVGSQKYLVRRGALLRRPTGMQAGDELLDVTEIASRLGVPKSTVYELTRHRASVRHAHPLPCFKIGRRLKFNWTAVIAWLSELEKAGAR